MSRRRRKRQTKYAPGSVPLKNHGVWEEPTLYCITVHSCSLWPMVRREARVRRYARPAVPCLARDTCR
eukprot:4480090-Prymnesium_polylepis.1